MKNEVFTLIDIIGTSAFAISGVFAAMDKKLDLFGIFIIAFITAIGGGTLRDMLIGDLPVAWISSNYYSLVIFISASAALLFYRKFKEASSILLLFDSIGLGFFTILGIQKGIQFNLSVGLCIALGTITACFGGLIRDIVLNQIPQILQKEIYATACIAGGILYFLMMKADVRSGSLEAVCISVIVMIRLLAVKNKWSLPGVYSKRLK